MTEQPQGSAGEPAQVLVTIPAALYARLSDVAHDEGHSINEQVVRAIAEMLAERRRRPLFD
ncbi:MAG: hypothetical protein NTZ05_03590 [Chloroflexi bacterium]|nr:hypothetical protein [Chloroflexota bacterium]